MAVEIGNDVKGKAKGKSEQKKKAPKLTRQQKIQKAVDEGKPFSFVEKRKEPFQCICGGKGSNAVVLKDKNGKEVLVGSTCVKYTGVTIPRKPKKKKKTPAED